MMLFCNTLVALQKVVGSGSPNVTAYLILKNMDN
jgi:hypothetical protein